jgi:hypothetical protein
MAEGKPARRAKKSSAKGDKLEVIKILVLALVSFAAGFALVFLFLRPTPPDAADEQPDYPEQPGEPSEPGAGGGYAPADPQAGGDQASGGGYAPTGDDEGAQEPDEGAALPEVKPGKTPDGVVIDGDAFYLKCWDSDGVEHPGKDCDKLPVFVKRFSTRLYVVDKCRRDKAGETAAGKLSVAMEIDFQQMKISFWSGASSDIKNAQGIGACLKSTLAGLPIHGIDHKNVRYRMFFTVLFGGAATKKKQHEAAKEAKFVAGKGKLVDVVKDHVRVRKSPKDGEILGKISSGNQVRLLEKKAGWCHVYTPNKTEGWMICDALDL